MDRRKFIKQGGLLGLLTLLQACRLTDFGRDRLGRQPTASPTATATQHPTFTPTATSSPSPTVPASTNTPVASATPAEIPTVTPTSTFTPVPPPTTYPPGPPSKLGLFITRFHPKILEIVELGKPAIIKTIEVDGGLAMGLKASSPTTLMIGRLTLGNLNLEIDPQPAVQDYLNKVLPLATDTKRMDAFDGWEAYNEPIVDTPDKMKRLADFEAERTRVLAENGIRSVVGNFATGNPPLELWPHFAPALDAIRQYNGYLGLHEYSAPVMQYYAEDLQPNNDPGQGDEGWLTLRYRKVHRQHLIPMGFGDIPILMTECGVDGLVQPRPGPEQAGGWQDFIETWLNDGFRDHPAGVYMDQLIWYDQHLQQDNFVKGAAIFLAASGDQRWDSYDILGPNAGGMADLLIQYLQ
ncbi:MAG: hypothetical protein AAF485_28275, partial [Chloroflexota bacterium]